MPNIRRKYYLCPHKQKCFGLSLASSWCERKVRAAQDIPLPKIEAIGDSRCRQKKITTKDFIRNEETLWQG